MKNIWIDYIYAHCAFKRIQRQHGVPKELYTKIFQFVPPHLNVDELPFEPARINFYADPDGSILRYTVYDYSCEWRLNADGITGLYVDYYYRYNIPMLYFQDEIGKCKLRVCACCNNHIEFKHIYPPSYIINTYETCYKCYEMHVENPEFTCITIKTHPEGTL